MKDESPWLDDAEMAAWLAFLEVSHRLDRVIEQQLRQDAGLSHAQYEILSRLEPAPGGGLSPAARRSFTSRECRGWQMQS